MSYSVTFTPSVLRRRAHAEYRSDEFALEYRETDLPAEKAKSMMAVVEQAVGVKAPRDFLLIADTLTIAFAGPDKRLCALDAYTNSALWTPVEEYDLPDVMESGSIHLCTKQPDDDRQDLNVTPRYEFAAGLRRIRIVLRPGYAADYYEVSDSLVVGLSGGMLSDLYVTIVHPVAV